MPIHQVPQEQVHHPKAGHLGKEPYGAPESRNCRKKGVGSVQATPDCLVQFIPQLPWAIGSGCREVIYTPRLRTKQTKVTEAAPYL